MTEVCDNFSGWFGAEHVWAHCRDGESACLLVELRKVEDSKAYLRIMPSWQDGRDYERIGVGDFVEYTESGTRWKIYCDNLNQSQQLASIRICYGGLEEEGLQVGDSATINGHSFKLLEIVCGTNASIKATIDGITRRIPLLGKYGSLLLGSASAPGLALGGLYVAIRMVGTACDRILVEGLAKGGLTPEQQQSNEDRAGEEVINPDGTKPTEGEIREADTVAESQISDWQNTEYVKKVQQLTSGDITRESFGDWLQQATYDLKITILKDTFYSGNFHINIPTLVMAGDIKVSGDAPAQDQEIQIVAVRKYFGFDWLAADSELAKVTSDSEYQYEATLPLNEFGIVEVYARIPKAWWAVLEKDATTAKHTVFVLTWEIVLFLIIAAALIYDKKTGKLGLLKKKR